MGHLLPDVETKRRLNLMDHFQLHYGAMGIMVTPDQQHVFLDVNPVGEFFWLETCLGLPISQAIADLLLYQGE